MYTSIKARAASLVASILITFAFVYVVAEYAYPEVQATRVASTAR